MATSKAAKAAGQGAAGKSRTAKKTAGATGSRSASHDANTTTIRGSLASGLTTERKTSRGQRDGHVSTPMLRKADLPMPSGVVYAVVKDALGVNDIQQVDDPVLRKADLPMPSGVVYAVVKDALGVNDIQAVDDPVLRKADWLDAPEVVYVVLQAARAVNDIQPVDAAPNSRRQQQERASGVADIQRRAELRRAQERLNRIEEMREARQLADANKSQREIAEILQTTQPRVHRMLKAMEGRDPRAVSPEETILLAAVNGGSRADLIEHLAQRDYTFRQHAPEPFDGAISGSWDEVRQAWMAGLLSEEEYKRVRERVRPPSP
ncbi:hypothetical protein [Nocardioides sp. Leaf285]|uniref:hypothetical protein n=1 Tax=Nocardioides sp. Leaf285 TaxID=1736322 RepID=UPI0007037D04|nr:hypothetical protein [Nocardioides sp. Leaf285]KQP62950.1 hypothetical protein ASF47_18225 [Nocardioides sp. Leaf285]